MVLFVQLLQLDAVKFELVVRKGLPIVLPVLLFFGIFLTKSDPGCNFLDLSLRLRCLRRGWESVSTWFVDTLPLYFSPADAAILVTAGLSEGVNSQTLSLNSSFAELYSAVLCPLVGSDSFVSIVFVGS